MPAIAFPLLHSTPRCHYLHGVHSTTTYHVVVPPPLPAGDDCVLPYYRYYCNCLPPTHPFVLTYVLVVIDLWNYFTI